jgi:hypothetical protein
LNLYSAHFKCDCLYCMLFLSQYASLPSDDEDFILSVLVYDMMPWFRIYIFNALSVAWVLSLCST